MIASNGSTFFLPSESLRTISPSLYYADSTSQGKTTPSPPARCCLHQENPLDGCTSPPVVTRTEQLSDYLSVQSSPQGKTDLIVLDDGRVAKIIPNLGDIRENREANRLQVMEFERISRMADNMEYEQRELSRIARRNARIQRRKEEKKTQNVDNDDDDDKNKIHANDGSSQESMSMSEQNDQSDLDDVETVHSTNLDLITQFRSTCVDLKSTNVDSVMSRSMPSPRFSDPLEGTSDPRSRVSQIKAAHHFKDTDIDVFSTNVDVPISNKRSSAHENGLRKNVHRSSQSRDGGSSSAVDIKSTAIDASLNPCRSTAIDLKSTNIDEATYTIMPRVLVGGSGVIKHEAATSPRVHKSRSRSAKCVGNLFMHDAATSMSEKLSNLKLKSKPAERMEAVGAEADHREQSHQQTTSPNGWVKMCDHVEKRSRSHSVNNRQRNGSHSDSQESPLNCLAVDTDEGMKLVWADIGQAVLVPVKREENEKSPPQISPSSKTNESDDFLQANKTKEEKSLPGCKNVQKLRWNRNDLSEILSLVSQTRHRPSQEDTSTISSLEDDCHLNPAYLSFSEYSRNPTNSVSPTSQPGVKEAQQQVADCRSTEEGSEASSSHFSISSVIRGLFKSKKRRNSLSNASDASHEKDVEELSKDSQVEKDEGDSDSSDSPDSSLLHNCKQTSVTASLQPISRTPPRLKRTDCQLHLIRRLSDCQHDQNVERCPTKQSSCYPCRYSEEYRIFQTHKDKPSACSSCSLHGSCQANMVTVPRRTPSLDTLLRITKSHMENLPRCEKIQLAPTRSQSSPNLIQVPDMKGAYTYTTDVTCARAPGPPNKKTGCEENTNRQSSPRPAAEYQFDADYNLLDIANFRLENLTTSYSLDPQTANSKADKIQRNQLSNHQPLDVMNPGWTTTSENYNKVPISPGIVQGQHKPALLQQSSANSVKLHNAFTVDIRGVKMDHPHQPENSNKPSPPPVHQTNPTRIQPQCQNPTILSQTDYWACGADGRSTLGRTKDPAKHSETSESTEGKPKRYGCGSLQIADPLTPETSDTYKAIPTHIFSNQSPYCAPLHPICTQKNSANDNVPKVRNDPVNDKMLVSSIQPTRFCCRPDEEQTIAPRGFTMTTELADICIPKQGNPGSSTDVVIKVDEKAFIPPRTTPLDHEVDDLHIAKITKVDTRSKYENCPTEKTIKSKANPRNSIYNQLLTQAQSGPDLQLKARRKARPSHPLRPQQVLVEGVEKMREHFLRDRQLLATEKLHKGARYLSSQTINNTQESQKDLSTEKILSGSHSNLKHKTAAKIPSLEKPKGRLSSGKPVADSSSGVKKSGRSFSMPRPASPSGSKSLTVTSQHTRSASKGATQQAKNSRTDRSNGRIKP